MAVNGDIKKYLDLAGLRVVWDAIKAKFIDSDELIAVLTNYVTSVKLAEELAKYVKLNDFNAFAEVIEAKVEAIQGRVDQAEIDINALEAAIAALPDYTILKQSDSGEYAAVYRLLKGGVPVGDPININKDLLLKSVTIKTCTEKDQPVLGLIPGDKYIDFEFETTTGVSHSYLAVKDMVTPYKAGDGIAISADNVISVVNKVDKVLAGPKGIAYIFNEADGGGSKFVANNGVESFVGVNDGTNGLNAQIYADKLVDGKWQGTKIDVSNDGAYYTVGNKSAVERMVAENEIAVKGDINKKVDKELQGSVGTSFIFNESDGGGSQFRGRNNVVSYVGTHDNIGGEVGAQIYVDKATGAESTIIDVTQNGAFYTKGLILPGSSRDVEANEIATLGDIDSAVITLAEIDEICQ